MSKKWNWNKIQIFCQNKEELIKYLQEKSVLSSKQKCPTCSSDMKLDLDKEGWRCRKTNVVPKRGKVVCDTYVSLKKNSWFDRSKMNMGKILAITYLLLKNQSLQFVCEEMEINKNTATDWIKFVRQV